jgi:hypothetical protein
MPPEVSSSSQVPLSIFFIYLRLDITIVILFENADSVQDSLLYSRAFWVTQSIIAWNADVVRDGSCYLYASQIAALSVTDGEVEGHDFKIKLEEDSGGIPQNVRLI